MSVYVDDMRAPFGQMVMCHMWADTHDELLAMADTIGVARKWLQKPPKASWTHFDISLGKKAVAVAAGAILTDKYGPLEFLALRDMNSGDPDRIMRGRRKLKLVREVRAMS